VVKADDSQSRGLNNALTINNKEKIKVAKWGSPKKY
jgi:hypothetical protein